MNSNKRIDELSFLQNSAAERLPGMATKGTKTKIVTLCFLWLDSIFHQVPPDTENGKSCYLRGVATDFEEVIYEGQE